MPRKTRPDTAPPHCYTPPTCLINPDVGISVLPFYSIFPIAPHGHHFNELVIVLGGSGVHQTGDEVFDIARGEVFNIRGRRTHSYTPGHDLRLVNVLYLDQAMDAARETLSAIPGYPELLEEPDDRQQHGPFTSRYIMSEQELQQTERLLESLNRALQSYPLTGAKIVRAIFTQLLAHVASCFRQRPAVRAQRQLRLGEVFSYLEKNLSRELHLADLAKMVSMSERAFSRLFREATGVSAMEYLIRLRIVHACELLRGHCRQIKAVSYMLGFRDPNYFSRQFLKHTGLTPQQWRDIEGHPLDVVTGENATKQHPSSRSLQTDAK